MSKNTRTLMLSACAAGAIALAACSGAKKAAGGEEQASNAAASVAGPKPGQWETTIKLEKFEVDDKDPDLQEFFQSAVGQTNTSKNCLVAEDVAKPKADFFQGKDSGCDYDSFTMSGGKVDAKLTCKDGNSTVKVTMTGTYGEDSYEIHSVAEGELMPKTPGSMTMAGSGKWVGDCTDQAGQAGET